MFIIKTATGKKFDCDCALAPKDSEFGFVHLLNTDLKTVEKIFKNESELPFDLCPDFPVVAMIVEKNDGIELTLTHREEVEP